MSIDFSVNEKYFDRIKKAPFYYDENDLSEWKSWSDKWVELDWKDPKDE